MEPALPRLQTLSANRPTQAHTHTQLYIEGVGEKKKKGWGEAPGKRIRGGGPEARGEGGREGRRSEAKRTHTEGFDRCVDEAREGAGTETEREDSGEMSKEKQTHTRVNRESTNEGPKSVKQQDTRGKVRNRRKREEERGTYTERRTNEHTHAHTRARGTGQPPELSGGRGGGREGRRGEGDRHGDRREECGAGTA